MFDAHNIHGFCILISLMQMITSERHQKALLGGTERFVGKDHPDKLIPKVSAILAAFYNEDIITEEVLVAWGSKASKKYVDLSTSKKVRKAAQKFLEWLAEAESGSPALAALAARRSQAEQGLAVEQARWKPQIFAFGSYNMIKKYQSLIEPDWIAGVGINLTLFSPEDRASKVSSARETVRQAESLQAAASTSIATEVEAAFRKVEQAREQFNLLDSTIALAEENLRLRERGFEEAQSTSLDINDARNASARSKTARALAAYDYVIALVQLLHATGQTKALPEFIHQADTYLPQ